MKKLYIAPVADIVIVEGNTEVLDSNMVAFSPKEGTDGEKVTAKEDFLGSGSKNGYMGSAIWDDPEQ